MIDILKFLSFKLEDLDIFFLGNGEIQLGKNGNMLSNRVFEDNPLKDSIKRIIDMYYNDEKKHWEESGYPDNHIIHDLELLKQLIG